MKNESMSLSVHMELSDMDSARMIDWLLNATPYGQVTENVQKEVENPAWSPDQEDPNDPPKTITIQEWVTRPATPEEALVGYAQGLMNDSLQQAYSWSQQKAASEAAASVPPISPIVPPTPAPPVV
jgi:hypothetical protein